MSELVIALIGLISTVVSGWASWFFARKKYDSEVDNNLIENMQKSLDFYKQLSDDNKTRLEHVLKQNEELSKEVADLRKQVFELMASICYNTTCALREKQPKKVITKKNKKDETKG